MNYYCYVCGKEVKPDVDCESRFSGKSGTKYVCFECAANGGRQVEKHQAHYFYCTYEGRKRLKNGEQKKKEK